MNETETKTWVHCPGGCKRRLVFWTRDLLAVVVELGEERIEAHDIPYDKCTHEGEPCEWFTKRTIGGR